MAPHCTSGRKSHRARGAGASGRRTAVTGSKPRQKEPLCSFRDEDFEDFEDFTDSSPMSAKFPEPSICSSVRRSENTILVGPLSHCLSHSGMALTFWMGRQST